MAKNKEFKIVKGPPFLALAKALKSGDYVPFTIDINGIPVEARVNVLKLEADTTMGQHSDIADWVITGNVAIGNADYPMRGYYYEYESRQSGFFVVKDFVFPYSYANLKSRFR